MQFERKQKDFFKVLKGSYTHHHQKTASAAVWHGIQSYWRQMIKCSPFHLATGQLSQFHRQNMTATNTLQIRLKTKRSVSRRIRHLGKFQAHNCGNGGTASRRHLIRAEGRCWHSLSSSSLLMAVWVVFVCKLLWLSCTWPNFDVFTSFPILFRGEKWGMNMNLSSSRWELED